MSPVIYGKQVCMAVQPTKRQQRAVTDSMRRYDCYTPSRTDVPHGL